MNQKYDWVAISACISAASVFIVSITLITTWCKNTAERRFQRSLSFLEQAQKLLANTISLFEGINNDNIKWHNAISSLLLADELKNELTEEVHKRIFLLEYIDAAYKIGAVLTKIDNFRFFYGIIDYKNKDIDILYEESSPEDVRLKTSRISPDLLLTLYAFLDKVNRMHFDRSDKKTNWHKIFKSPYFQKVIDNNVSYSGFGGIPENLIFDYVRSYRTQQTQKRKFNK